VIGNRQSAKSESSSLMEQSMELGAMVMLTGVLAALYVPLALIERQHLGVRSAYALVSLLLTLSLGLFFASMGEKRVRSNVSRVREMELSVPISIEIDVATRWATQFFGGWLVVMAAGELLRLLLKRPATSGLLGPIVLFSAGAMLLQPQWVIAVPFAISILCLTASLSEAKAIVNAAKRLGHTEETRQ
jgi:hypothetical protein